MKATDFRNATFEGLKDRLEGLRKEVYRAWSLYGPGTTEQVAARAGMDILTFRPRSTELHQMGLLMISGRKGRSGIYEVATGEG